MPSAAAGVSGDPGKPDGPEGGAPSEGEGAHGPFVEGRFRLFFRFLRFGCLAWGGPIPQIAMVRQELVEEEQWISRERFNRVLGIYQALPGPEAHELCVYFGMISGGRWGGFLAGLGFMLPGFVLMFALSWFYLAYGMAIPHFSAVFHGLQAAVGAMILRALHRIGGHALKGGGLWFLAAAAVAGEAAGVSFLVTLPAAGAANLFLKNGQRGRVAVCAGLFLAAVLVALGFFQSGLPSGNTSAALPSQAASPADLLLSGLKSGLLTFGGAYTVITFLQHDAVTLHGWMSNAQFLDGLALSGVLPAPLIIFATFVGFAAGGASGALLMTLGIFLPAFSFTLVGHGLIERIIGDDRLHAFLDGVTAAVVGLMAWTTVNLLRAGIDDWSSAVICGGTLVTLILWKTRWVVAAVMVASGFAGFFLG